MELKLKYSDQAKSIINNLKENSINISEFEKWVMEHKFIVGGGYIVEYLENRRINGMG